MFWALKLLYVCAFWAQNRQDGAHVQKITNGGYSLYVPVQSCFEAALSISWGILKGVDLQLSPVLGPLQIPLLMDTAASKQLCTGTYKLHPPLIVITCRKHQCRHSGHHLRGQNAGTDVSCM